MRSLRSPDDLIVPTAILYVNAPRAGAVGLARKDFHRQLRAVSRRARRDGVEPRMTLLGDPAAPRVDDVCPSLAWLAELARSSPMPRLLFVADFADLAGDRRALVATLDDLFEADVAVRACGGLVAASGRSLATFRGVPSPAPAVVARPSASAPSRRPAAPSAARAWREP